MPFPSGLGVSSKIHVFVIKIKICKEIEKYTETQSLSFRRKPNEVIRRSQSQHSNYK